jgi:Transposase IS116/IS110/IS902 family
VLAELSFRDLVPAIWRHREGAASLGRRSSLHPDPDDRASSINTRLASTWERHGSGISSSLSNLRPATPNKSDIRRPGFGWITSFTVACEIADINRFSSPVKLTGYTGLCPRVKQSGQMDQRGPLSKHGPKYLRWGLMEAAIAASSHPLYRERYQRTKGRLGRQRGPKVAQIDLARQLTEAIWYMLTRNQPFAPAGAIYRLAA